MPTTSIREDKERGGLIVITDLRNGSRVGGNVARTAEEVLKDLPGKSGRIKHVSNQKALDELFESLTCGGKSIDPGTYKGVVKQLPDGTIVRRRPWSSQTHDPTLDITLPNGKNITVHIKP